MNTKTLIATTLFVSFAGAGSAFAQEATQDFPPAQRLSSKSARRSPGRTAAAQRAGTLQPATTARPRRAGGRLDADPCAGRRRSRAKPRAWA